MPPRAANASASAITRASRAAVFLLASGCGGGGGGDAPQSAPPSTFNVELTVSGLTGEGLTLQSGGLGMLTVSADGDYVIASDAPDGTRYDVTIATQPTSDPLQTCHVVNGSGVVDSRSVTNIRVECRNVVGRFVYVANAESNDVSAFSVDPDTGGLTPVQGAPFSTAAPSNGTHFEYSEIAVVDGRFVYVLRSTLTESPPEYVVSAFAIDQGSGALASADGVPAEIGLSARPISVHPSGRHLVVHDYGRNDVPENPTALRVFAINATTGDLTEVPGSPFEAPAGALRTRYGSFDDSGNWYYVASLVRTADYGYAFADYAFDAATGELRFESELGIPPPPSVQGLGFSGFTIHPSGELIIVAQAGFNFDSTDYVVSNLESVVSVVEISPAEGLLGVDSIDELEGESRYLAPVLVSSDGLHAYFPDASRLVNGVVFDLSANDQNPGSVVAVEIDVPSRTLTEVDGSPFSTGGHALRDFGLHDDLLFGANTTEGTIAWLRIDDASGELTHTAQSPLAPAIGSWPVLTIDPSGDYAYATDAATDSISVYAIERAERTLDFIASYATGESPGHAVVVGLQ